MRAPDRYSNRARRKTHNGFLLIELLIVVAIILLLAAIAIPNLLTARMAANEASAIGSFRTNSGASPLSLDPFPGLKFSDPHAGLSQC